MPVLGEIKTGRELGNNRFYNKYIYHACIDCGKERWTGYDGNVVDAIRCKTCSNRVLASKNPFLYKSGIGSGLTPHERHQDTLEYREKQRLIHLGLPSWNKGKKHPNLGAKLSLLSKGQHRSPMTEFKKGQFAKEKHPFWKGGITTENRLSRNTKEFKEWRKKVFGRDNYTCQKCKATKNYLHPHHIKEFSKYPELRFDVNNGITLCRDCHLRLHGLLKGKNVKTNN